MVHIRSLQNMVLGYRRSYYHYLAAAHIPNISKGIALLYYCLAGALLNDMY